MEPPELLQIAWTQTVLILLSLCKDACPDAALSNHPIVVYWTRCFSHYNACAIKKSHFEKFFYLDIPG